MPEQDTAMHAVSFALLLAASSPDAAVARIAPASASPGPPTLAAPRAQAAPARGVTNLDRAANLVGGVWQCETIAGSTGTHTYTGNDSGDTMEMQTELHTGARTFRITETYRYDDGRKAWDLKTQGGSFTGSAPPWNAYKWIFTGTETFEGKQLPIRMVYFDLGDQAFRRDFQAMQDNAWRTYSAETCRRPSS